MRSLLRLGLFLFTIVGAAVSADAQTVNVTGTVKDTSGAVLPGATIDATVVGLSVASTVTDRTAATRSRSRRVRNFNCARAWTVSPRRRSTSGPRRRPLTHDFTLRIAAVADRWWSQRRGCPRAARRRPSRYRCSRPAISRRSAPPPSSTRSAWYRRSTSRATGREGALSSLFARGGESDYNLVLIDGVRVNPSGGAFDFSRISAARYRSARGRPRRAVGALRLRRDRIGRAGVHETRDARRCAARDRLARRRQLRHVARRRQRDRRRAATRRLPGSAPPIAAPRVRSRTSCPSTTRFTRDIGRRRVSASSSAIAPRCGPACATRTAKGRRSVRSTTARARPARRPTRAISRGISTSTSS